MVTALPVHEMAASKRVSRSQRKRQILDAAVEEFGLNGYAGASMVAIAGRVGVTKPVVYNYFATKQQLYQACLTSAGGELIAAVRSATAKAHRDQRDLALPAAPGAPRSALNDLFAVLEGRRGAWLLLSDPYAPRLNCAERYRTQMNEIAASHIAHLLDPTGAEGVLEVDVLKDAWQALVTALVRWWARHPDQPPYVMAERCARLLATTEARGAWSASL